MDIKLQILEKAENDYKEFFSSLIPNINNVLGVRLPVLRKIAKEIYKSEKWEDFIKQTDCQYMEEIMLQGMVIGLVKKSPEEILELVKDFVPKINNWAVCDTFCVGLKFTNNNKELVWNFIQPYFTSKEEYDIRFGYVMLLSYFIDNDYIDRVLDLIDNFRDER